MSNHKRPREEVITNDKQQAHEHFISALSEEDKTKYEDWVTKLEHPPLLDTDLARLLAGCPSQAYVIDGNKAIQADPDSHLWRVIEGDKSDSHAAFLIFLQTQLDLFDPVRGSKLGLRYCAMTGKNGTRNYKKKAP